MNQHRRNLCWYLLEIRLAFVALVMLCGLSCRAQETSVEQHENHGEETLGNHTEASGHHVHVSPEVEREAGIQKAVVGKVIVWPGVAVAGEVVAIPERMSVVSARISGVVERVHVNVGDVVKVGDLLVSLRGGGVSDVRSERRSLQLRAAAAAANVSRLEALSASGLGATQELVAARAEVETLRNQARATGERLRGLGARSGGVSGAVELRANQAGVVLARGVMNGEFVSEERELVVLADLSEVWFEGRVSEHSLPLITTGATARVHLFADPQRDFHGEVTSVAPIADPETHQITARIPLTNHEGRLRVGSYGTAWVSQTVTEQIPVLAVPHTAITFAQNKPYAFVDGGAGDFEAREIRVGRQDHEHVELLSGLLEGERVVVDGAFVLKSLWLGGSLHGGHH